MVFLVGGSAELLMNFNAHLETHSPALGQCHLATRESERGVPSRNRSVGDKGVAEEMKHGTRSDVFQY